uniref:Condensin complex subunit 2 n=1 Tax=Timema shepardi TaxID=629360 RepID=A0A7R9FVN9_TIMSH|nr:unnamed protein product [Timema shepardi]
MNQRNAMRRSMGPISTPLLRKSTGSTSSPLRRKSMGVTPANEVFLPENDDAAERLQRDSNTSSRLDSLGAVADKSTPLVSALSGLTHDQMQEHYAKCMKLSSENKINIKNAFNLQLIDYMTQMVKKKEFDISNFQVAGCTLDASTKIYSYRVDGVHSVAIRMAGGLHQEEKKKKKGQNDEEENDENQPEGDESITIAKKKKPRRHRNVLAESSSLNAKEDSNPKLDPYFRRLMSALGETQEGDCQFLTSVKVGDDSCALQLFPEIPFWGEKQIVQAQQGNFSLPALPELGDLEICSSFSHFTFNNWSLEEDLALEERMKGNRPSAVEGVETPDNPLPLEPDEEFAFDMAASPPHAKIKQIEETYCIRLSTGPAGNNGSKPPDELSLTWENKTLRARDDWQALPMPSAGWTCAVTSSRYEKVPEARHACILFHFTCGGADDYDTDGEVGDTGIEIAVTCRAQDKSSLAIVDLHKHLSIAPQEYSYFRGSKSSTSEVGAKEEAKKRRKKDIFVDFDALLHLEELNDKFSQIKGAKLSRKTVQMWSKERNTFPKDEHFISEVFYQLEIRKCVIVRRCDPEQSQIVDGQVDDYNYDNEHDRSSYCPNVDDTFMAYSGEQFRKRFLFSKEVVWQDIFPMLEIDNPEKQGLPLLHLRQLSTTLQLYATGGLQDDDGDGVAPLDDEGMTPFEEAPPPSQDIHMSDSQMPGTFTGDNLVEPPSKVARVFIPYALRPKKMDMKKLKAQIWSLLVHWNTRKEKVQPPTYDSTKVEGEIRFTEVFKELPSKLSATMIDNLSFPLAYIALLHLANEKCLLIVGDENLEDLMVSQDL